MSTYTIHDAGKGLEKAFAIAPEIINTITLAMDAVEAMGVLKGDVKKKAVFDMVRGIVDNFDEIETLLSKLVDAVKRIYNAAKGVILEVFS